MSLPGSKSRKLDAGYFRQGVALAGRRLVFAVAFFFAVAFSYLFVDEIPALYETIDGYIEVLYVVRFGLTVALIGILLGSVRPLAVLIVLGFFGLLGREQDSSTVHRHRTIVGKLLYLAVLLFTFFFVREDYERTVFPFYDVEQKNELLIYLWLAFGLLTVSQLIFRLTRRPRGER